LSEGRFRILRRRFVAAHFRSVRKRRGREKRVEGVEGVCSKVKGAYPPPLLLTVCHTKTDTHTHAIHKYRHKEVRIKRQYKQATKK